MRKEVIVTAKTIDSAVEIGAAQLNIKKEDATFEVLELPKKGLFGRIGAADAKVKVSGKMSASDIAVEYIEKIISHMDLSAKVIIKSETKEEINIDIVGENLGILIGYHGEVLDSIQYLTFLAVNKDAEDEDETEFSVNKADSIKIHIDVENYREKRKQTLEALANKMAQKVLKYKRPITLEPMNSYERRIIHSVIQDIEGVTTYSTGQDNERKIVITREGFNKRSDDGYPSANNKKKKPYSSTKPPFYNNKSAASDSKSTYHGNKTNVKQNYPSYKKSEYDGATSSEE